MKDQTQITSEVTHNEFFAKMKNLSEQAYPQQSESQANKIVLYDEDFLKEYLLIVMTSSDPNYSKIKKLYSDSIFDKNEISSLEDIKSEHLTKLANRLVENTPLATYGKNRKTLLRNGSSNASNGRDFTIMEHQEDSLIDLSQYLTNFEQFISSQSITVIHDNFSPVGDGSRNIFPSKSSMEKELIKSCSLVRGVGIQTNAPDGIDGRVFCGVIESKIDPKSFSVLTDDPKMKILLNKYAIANVKSFTALEADFENITKKPIKDFLTQATQDELDKVRNDFKDSTNHEIFFKTTKNPDGSLNFQHYFFNRETYKQTLKNRLNKYLKGIDQTASSLCHVKIQGLGLGVWAPKSVNPLNFKDEDLRLRELYLDCLKEITNEQKFSKIQSIETVFLYFEEKYDSRQFVEDTKGILSMTNSQPLAKGDLDQEDRQTFVIYVGDPSAKIGNEIYFKIDEYTQQFNIAKLIDDLESKITEKSDDPAISQIKDKLIEELSTYKETEKFKDKDKESDKQTIESIISALQEGNGDISHFKENKVFKSLRSPQYGSGDPAMAISCIPVVRADRFEAIYIGPIKDTAQTASPSPKANELSALQKDSRLRQMQ
jgi:hypothetical protein